MSESKKTSSLVIVQERRGSRMVRSESVRDKGRETSNWTAMEGGWKEARNKGGGSRRGQRKLDFFTVASKKQHWELREISWTDLELDGRKA